MKKPEKSELNDIKTAAEILKNGGVVIFPTDTVYGIGCRFDSKRAKERIYKIKGTPKSQPFPILVSSTKQVKSLVKITTVAKALMDKHWPGGLTAVLKGRQDRQKYGFRMPDYEQLLSIIEDVGVPIIGTSANFHGQKPPSSFEELDPRIVKLADFIIKGECYGKVESTVVDVTISPPKILRKGAITFDDFKN